MSYCLAIDIGASSGRHLLGEIKDGKLDITEIYRFENGIKEVDGTLVWDTDALCESVIAGLAKCKEAGKIPHTVAIDTWGVDYVLLDENSREILPCVAYRDPRTEGVPEEIYRLIDKNKLYRRTGIGEQNYNTIFQLWCDKLSGKMDKASHLLMMPDYLSYKLTGVVSHEYTICSTTGLVNAQSRSWDSEVLETLGYKKELFKEISEPCTPIGGLSKEIRERVGFDCLVMHCPAHDTASAVAACPIGDDSLFISSGTWSLVGTENTYPVTTDDAMNAGLSNEGGIEGSYRFLKNIMGMWLFQSIRRELNSRYTYDEMMQLAMESSFKELIDPTDNAFLAPKSMIDAVRNYLGKPDLPLADVLSSVYHSLANSYTATLKELEGIAGKKINQINIVGGGCRDRYLNQLTKQYTGKKVTAGPVECTATGNIMSQLFFLDKSMTLENARELVKRSFDIAEV
ncbi:MAG: rhamnulokinase [Oscillospiraceae bacterium]|nr:rhamnulokinase [Oscillospiraceae bacterium]